MGGAWRFPRLAGTCVAFISLASAAPTRAGVAACVGDCNGDGTVSINELITAVNIALEVGSLSTCPSIDADHSGGAEVPELIRAVNGALSTCSREEAIDVALRELAAGNVINAESQFAAAVRAHPTDARAVFFLAVTSLATRVAGDATLLDLLGRGRIRLQGGLDDLCTMGFELPDTVPLGAPRSGEIFDKLRTAVVPELQDALDRLQNIKADEVIPVALDTLPECMRPGDNLFVEIDHGDVLALRALLLATQAAAHLLTAYNLDLRLDDAAELPALMVFEAAPSLLTLRSAAELTAAGNAARLAAETFVDAIDAIQNETDDQSNDALVILPEDADLARQLRTGVLLFRDALQGEVVVPTDFGLTQPRRVNLQRLFDGRLSSLRTLVPAFALDGDPDPSRFPDPTFAGIFPDLSQRDIDEVLSGGPRCAACENDGDCVGLGISRLRCYECAFDCGSETAVQRCGDPSTYIRCSDGYY